jgi:hypothetical protein
MRLCLKLRFFFYRKKKQKGSSKDKDFAFCGKRQKALPFETTTF